MSESDIASFDALAYKSTELADAADNGQQIEVDEPISAHGDADVDEQGPVAHSPVLCQVDEPKSSLEHPNSHAPVESVPCDDFDPPIQNAVSNSELSERRLSTIEITPPSLDADSSPGQVRYYGPTTQLHIQSRGEDSAGTRFENEVTADFAIDIDSPQLRENLLKLYWGNHTRAVRVVDEHLFLTHRKAGKRSQYYSSFLESALLACAARLKTSQAVRKLGRSYADRAKQHLVYELEQPTIATLQGFLLLSDFEATSARDRVGWTYNGIACRLLFDLGLHQDCTQLVKHGILVETDANLRIELFLCAFVYDRLWALYLGRPSCIPLASFQQRRPCVESTQHPMILTYWTDLCGYISEVTEILNGHLDNLDHKAAEHLTNLSSRIFAAHSNLPPEFSCKHMSELHVTAYGLNMQYCGIQIVLHRVLIKVQVQRPNEGLDMNCDQVDKSRYIMFENAISICRLVLAYREIFGIDNFITVMLDNMYIAASTLISHILQPPANQGSDMSNAHQFLQIISETMALLQKHYPVTERMRHTLSLITENTPLAGLFGSSNAHNNQMRNLAKGLPVALVPPISGSWGSMEALVHDDSILSQNNLFADVFSTEPALEDTSWIHDVDLGMLN
ncbi:hypothetical protein FDECE_9070 [Fusarium decemcellulare]|nr:hypothetical protein FDECE_9070 [Fusarium decemcellulare]